MPITTLKVLASVLQLHGPGATIQSDHDWLVSQWMSEGIPSKDGLPAPQNLTFVEGMGDHGGVLPPGVQSLVEVLVIRVRMPGDRNELRPGDAGDHHPAEPAAFHELDGSLLQELRRSCGRPQP